MGNNFIRCTSNSFGAVVPTTRGEGVSTSPDSSVVHAVRHILTIQTPNCEEAAFTDVCQVDDFNCSKSLASALSTQATDGAASLHSAFEFLR